MGQKADGKFILKFARAPGDVLMVTSLVRDIKLTYGDRYIIDVRCPFPGLWRNNPYLTSLDDHARDVKVLQLKEILAMNKAKTGERLHYVRGFHFEFERVTGIHVPCLFPHADLHLSEEEKTIPYISGRYWVILPGGKEDITAKAAYIHRYQETVDRLRPWGLKFVQEGATKKLCMHPPLKNVLNVIGKTSIRDMIVNIYHAEGVICGVSLPMHIAGALQRPCVVTAGGREEPWFEEYSDNWDAFGPKCAPTTVPHRFLHTLGLLSCCHTRGCWKRRTVMLPDRQHKWNKSLCLRPVLVPGLEPVPECMAMISTDHMVEAVMSYYEEGYLLPLQQQKSYENSNSSHSEA